MIKLQDFFLVRTPSFSISKLLKLNRAIDNKDIDIIKGILNEKFFLDAVYFSSRYFYEVLKKWIDNNKIIFDANDSILLSAYKYYIRICSRATPYGLFAGFSYGNITDEFSNISFDDIMYQPIFRVDMLFLKQNLYKIIYENLDKNFIFFPNNTIYKVHEDLRYIEWDADFNYEISNIQNNFIVNYIIKNSKKGISQTKIKDLIKSQLPDASNEEINKFIFKLIENKIIVTNSPPYMTSENSPLEDVINYLAKLNISEFKDVQKLVYEQKEKINVYDIEKLALKYQDFTKKNNQIFQVDTKINLKEKNLNHSSIEFLTQSAKDLLSINKPNKSNRIIKFCEDYSNKFENKQISLVNALDPQIGVGYGLRIEGNIENTPLLDDLELNSLNDNNNIIIPEIIKLVLKKYKANLTSNNTIKLTKIDLSSLSKDIDNSLLCEDYCLFGDLISQSDKSIDNNEFKFLAKAPIPSPNFKNLLSRFAYHDDTIKGKIKDSLITNSNYIYAEVLHYPSDRIGNVLLRPNFYEYEIPYISTSNTDKIKIDINDIILEVKGDSVYLKSKSLKKYIIPKFSTAYNYELSQLSIVKFLCDLQYHNKYFGFSWDWSILNDNEVLPRVEYQNIVLTEARWILKKQKYTLDNLSDKIKKTKIPRYCKIKENDNVLTLDLENTICKNLVIKKLKKENVFLYECIDLEKGSIVQSKIGKHVAEFILPITTKKFDFKRSVNLPRETKYTSTYFPSQEWSYFKIYCSLGLADEFIYKVLSPIIENYSDISFFIRYSDPENHLRFRVKSNKIDYFMNLIYTKSDSFIKQGTISKIQIDTYKREIERYGLNNIENSENLFYHDSLAVSKFIGILSNFQDEDLRWKTAIISIDILLDDFMISIEDRVDLFSDLYEQFFSEFADVNNLLNSKTLKRSLDEKVRENRVFLDNVLRLKFYSEELQELIKPFEERSENHKNTIGLIKEHFNEKSDLINLLKSYIHMTLNRIIPSQARKHELIIYFFMFRQYKSNFKRNER